METHEAQAQQERKQRNQLIVFGVLLTILLCVLLAPARHLYGWWNADTPDEVTDTSSFDVTDTDGHLGAHALNPFRTSADRLFPLDDVADHTGLEGILIAGFATTTATPDPITLIASTDVDGALDDGAFRNGALGTAGFGDGAFGGYLTAGAAWPGGPFVAGGSASGFGGGGSSAGAASSQSESRQSRSGHTLRTDLGDGSGLGAPGSGSSDTSSASGSGDAGNPGGSGGGSGDSIVFVSDPGDQGPADGGVNVSVYPSGSGGGTILSDPSADPPLGSGPGGVSFSAADPTPVPEPATLLLLGFGLVATGYRLNRRKLS
jgi:hypothetical protein